MRCSSLFKWTGALVLGVLLCLSTSAKSETTIADTGEFVIDRAAVLDFETKRKLEGWLKELQQKTTAQVKVLTVRNTAGEDFFSFVQRHAEQWKLGQKGKNNGVLVVLDVDEHH